MKKILICISMMFCSSAIAANSIYTTERIGKINSELISHQKMIIFQTESQLTQAEQILSRIQRKKHISQGNMESFEQAMFNYASSMKKAYDNAIKQAKKYSGSKGKQASIDALNRFEKIAHLHINKTKQIESRSQIIEKQIKTAKITLDSQIIKNFSRQEFKNFKQSLAPAGLRHYQKIHPRLFEPRINQPGRDFQQHKYLNHRSAIDIEREEEICNTTPLLEQVGNFFISPVEAKVAAPCIYPCARKKWRSCRNCVIRAGSQAIRIWNDFVRSWNRCKRKSWWKRWWCKSKAVARFVYRIG